MEIMPDMITSTPMAGTYRNTLSMQAERLGPGASSPASQETASFVYHVFEGEGYTVIDSPGREKDSRTIHWTTRDTFAVPAWSRIVHTNTSTEGKQAFLVAINDRPMVEALGLMQNAATFTGRV